MRSQFIFSTRLVSVLLITTSLILSGPLLAQRNFDDVSMQRTALSDTVHMLVGAGGNIGVSIGADGVFIIDDQFAPLSDKIRSSIAELTDQPIRFVINTHWHGDHTGGNEAFGSTGSVIIAHDNVRKRMASDQFIERFEMEVPAAPGAALPVVTFNDKLSLHLNGESVVAHHQSHAHTDGDSIIHFPDSNVIHMGDTFFNGGYPFIDISSGGTINGVIRSAANALQLANETTKIIPGHGPLSTRSDLQAYHDMLIQVRDLVQAQLDKGHDLDQAVAAKPTAELDEQWGQGFIDGDGIVNFVFQSLKQAD